MNKGYTLIELLGVILILTLLTLLVVPNVVNSIKKSGSNSDELMSNMIKSAAKLYMSDNFSDIYIENGFHYCIPLSKLVDDNYLEAPIKYKNYDDITSSKAVKVTYNDIYDYIIVDRFTCSNTNNLVLQNQSLSDKAYFLNTDIVKDSIEKIYTLDEINIPSSAIKTYDVSELQNESIMLWYTDSDSNNLYEVYIASNNGVNANRNSRRLFANLTNTTLIDLTYLNTGSVVNMSYMFENCTNLTDLTINTISTLNVTDMSYMFLNCSSITNIDMSSTTTEHLLDSSNMFFGTTSLTDLNLTSAEFRSTNVSSNMFKNSKDGITVRTNSIATTFISNNLSSSGVTNPNIIIPN